MLKFTLKNNKAEIDGWNEFPVRVSYSISADFENCEWTDVGEFEKEIQFEALPESTRIYYKLESENMTDYVASREVVLSGTFNFRDLGGYLTDSGKKVKWGKLYRSDALNNLSIEDKKYLEKSGIRTVVDLRGENECEVAPDVRLEGANYYNLSPHAPIAVLSTGNIIDDRAKIEKIIEETKNPGAKELFEKRSLDMREQMVELAKSEYSLGKYRKMFELLLNGETPIVEHCKGGKDRAGFGAMLILMALGVNKETIIYDYMLTAEYMKERNIKRLNEYRQYTDNEMVLDYLYSLMATKEIYIEGALEVIGEDFNDYLISNNLLSLNEIEMLKNLYLY